MISLKPQDIFVLLKIAVIRDDWNYRLLADELFMSTSGIHDSIQRVRIAKLYNARTKRARTAELEEFIIHGLKYAFPVERGTVTPGTPTSYLAPPLSELIVSAEEAYGPVWPDPYGKVRGYGIEPLHESVVPAAKIDQQFYELLSIVEAIREGRAREKEIASKLFKERIKLK